LTIFIIKRKCAIVHQAFILTCIQAGTYLATAGAVSKESCLPCPEGKVSVAGSNSCESCPVAKFSTFSMKDTDGFGLTKGATFCASCPPGRINPVKSATQCTACAAGYTSEANSTECFKCGEILLVVRYLAQGTFLICFCCC
jgi:hypothetical protein